MDYSNKFLHEFAKTVDSKSILVINWHGRLRRIFCPFPVVALVKAYSFEKGQVLSVESVKVTVQLQDIFIIGGKAYLIKYFGIIAED
jgi:hypothetical protein